VISHLTAVSEELVDVPLYFSLHDVCKTVKCTPPKADVLRSALINAGEPSLVLIAFFTCFQFAAYVGAQITGVLGQEFEHLILMVSLVEQYHSAPGCICCVIKQDFASYCV